MIRVDLQIEANILDVANRAAAVLDYDTGGANTFGGWPLTSDGLTISHYFASTLLNPKYLPAFETPEAMKAALDQLAVERDREPLTLADCQSLHAGLRIADRIDYEAEGLKRFEDSTENTLIEGN